MLKYNDMRFVLLVQDMKMDPIILKVTYPGMLKRVGSFHYSVDVKCVHWIRV
jgi:hypothetical protein